jgi:poly(A) polymerase
MNGLMLPDSAWRQADGLKRVVAALADDHGGPRIVGGAVRDTLLGLPVTDIDLATMLEPPEVIDRLEAAAIRAVPTGIDHGTITAVANGCNHEITTLRRDVTTDGRRATVRFSTDWREDAARRDFTINAIYADPATGEIFDYFGGIADLYSGRIRFIGNAAERIAEDHLRILRYFRFLARFGKGELDAEAIAACAAAANSLMALSRERISGELLKLLALPDPRQSVAAMVRHGIFAPFLPELATDAIAGLDRLWQREQDFSQLPSLRARMVAIIVQDRAIMEKVAIRLKLSNRLRTDLTTLLGHPVPTPDTIRSIAYRHGPGHAHDVAMLFASDHHVADCVARLENWPPPAFTMKGSDLIARGLSAGPIVARTLKLVEQSWIDEGFPPGNRLDVIADQAASAALSASRKL